MKLLFGQCLVVLSFLLFTPALSAANGTDNARVFSPQSWFNQGQPAENTLLALNALLDARSQGLNPDDYSAAQLAQAVQNLAMQPALVSQEKSAELSKQIGQALVRYVRDLNQGRLNPTVLKHQFKAPERSAFNADAYLEQALATDTLSAALRQAQPAVPLYAELRDAMNAYRAIGDSPAWHQPFPAIAGKSVKPGETWPGLDLLVRRLVILGDLPDHFTVPSNYEGDVVDGVKRFQTRHGLEPDGVIGRETLNQLNVSPAQRVEQMALTLERLRWTPLLHGKRMIVVNVPEFMLRAYTVNDDKTISIDLEMRVIVGRALDTRTPIFLEDMRFIEFSPYWNIPSSIARSETLPRLRRDPGYFARQGLEFVTRDGQVITTLTDEGIDAVQRGEWRIRQRPGPQNALGDIKFIFPNDQNIYLHHTPSQNLFSRTRRDFSHGCIRVEEPVKLAEFVLAHRTDWPQERIIQAMEGGKSRTLRLDAPLPVLITYSTSLVKDGKVYFFPDIYQQDARLQRALQTR